MSPQPNTRPWEQKGIREYLLCSPCEQKLNRWETYAKEVIFEDELHVVARNPLGLQLGGVDYTRFKLYLLSVLWRMGVSTRPMFAGVDLSEHEETLRNQLLREEPGEPHEFVCLITALLLNGRFHPDWILQPDMYEDEGIQHVRAVISGVLYVFRLSAEKLPISAEAVISRSGSMFVAVKDVREVPFANEALKRNSEFLNRRTQ